MNYGMMNVHDLLEQYHVACSREIVDDGELSALESAIKRVVIRRASVGEIIIEQHEGYMSPDPLFTVGSDSKLKAGTFYIVPKENP
jgi:hypothetical protein